MGVRTRRARQHSKTHVAKFGIAGFFGFIALLCLALAMSLGSLVSSWLEDLPNYTSADSYVVGEPTTVYAADNSVIAEFYLQNRRSVTSDQISPYVLKAVVDTEDSRFYKHNGVDPQGIVRAIVKTARGRSEGASTITQQLVRNTVLSKEQFEQTLRRKVREAYISIQMEKIYTKDQILNMYLNTIYFGHGAYGIQAAAITYFNTSAKDLTLAQAAMISGLPQAPSRYDPFVNPDAATSRRNMVLDRMLAAGDISQEEHDAAVAEPLEIHPGKFSTAHGRYPYIADYIKQLLLADFDQDTVMQGGLKVYTTIDPAIQDNAQAAVAGRLKAIGNKRLESALVAIDPQTGYVKAMVGGKDYNSNQFNLATQAHRQAGSAFKTFTLACAINEGVDPTVRINANSPYQASPVWKVSNFGFHSYGTISLTQAFAVSSNTAFVQLIQAIGADKVAEMAHNLGIKTKLPPYDSMTLGTDGIPVLQMADAYATLASGGIHRDPVSITAIKDRNGNSVYEHADKPTRVLSPEVAEATLNVMKAVVQTGTAKSLQGLVHIKQPMAGKTGTSEAFRDLWYCGVTPSLSVAVWSGYIQEASVRVRGSNGSPALTSVPIYADFINRVLGNAPSADFPHTDATVQYKPNTTWVFKNTTPDANIERHDDVADGPQEATPTETTPRQERPGEEATPREQNGQTPPAQEHPRHTPAPAPAPGPAPAPAPAPEPAPAPAPPAEHH